MNARYAHEDSAGQDIGGFQFGRIGNEAPVSPSFENSVRRWGEKIFALMDAAVPPSWFSAKGRYGALMDWAMKDEQFKVQLFRFVDVLPALASSREVSRHLTEYLGDDQVKLPPVLRAALKGASFAGGLLGGGIRAQVTGLAHMFMLGDDGAGDRPRFPEPDFSRH